MSQPVTGVDLRLRNIKEAIAEIGQHHPQKTVQMVLPRQYVEGGKVAFKDDLGGVIATGRLRFANVLRVDSATGEMSMQVFVSDMTFNNKDTLTITIAPESAADSRVSVDTPVVESMPAAAAAAAPKASLEPISPPHSPVLATRKPLASADLLACAMGAAADIATPARNRDNIDASRRSPV